MIFRHGAMESNSEASAILFVDICESTQLFEKLGDTRALAMTSGCLKQMERCITQEGGVVQQAQGDGFLCTFFTAEAALQATQSIQNLTQNGPLSVHAGLHFGPMILRESAIYGDAVNVAARMLELAKKGETIISEDAWRQLPREKQAQLRTLGRVTIKGKSGLIKIFLATPQALDQTLVQFPYETNTNGWAVLKIDDGRQVYRVKAAASNFVLGRHGDCDLIINQKYVSRHHATIESMRGKFFLVDHSTNGSYVNEDNQPYKFLRREMLQLHGQGTISLGVDPVQSPACIIRYECDD